MMKLCCFLLMLCISTGGSLNTKIQSHLNQIHSQAHVGLYVMDPTTDQGLYEYNVNQAFVPASTLKIVTALAALKVLGPAFRFETLLAVDHQSYQGRLNLYVKFSGDPSLTKGDLLHLFEVLKDIGFKEWQGDIVIDDTCYGDMPLYNPGMMIEDMEFCAGRPVGPIIINENQDFMGLVLPTPSGEPLKIFPQETFYKIENHVEVENCTSDNSFDKKIIGQNLVFSGCLDPNTSITQLCIPIQNPKAFAVIVIKEIFQDLGIKLRGKIKFGKTPENAPRISRHFSASLSLLLRPVMKDSNNLFADAIFLRIGAALNSNLKNWPQVGALIKEAIKIHYGVDLSNSRMTDGSGLSRYNLLTPSQLGQLLKAAFMDPGIRNIFIFNLAVAGQEGTLKNRFQSSKRHKTFYGKTGSMSSIRSLAGYIKGNSKIPLIFVMMGNGIVTKMSDYIEFEDGTVDLFSKN